LAAGYLGVDQIVFVVPEGAGSGNRSNIPNGQ
jgi:hypothetical protein